MTVADVTAQMQAAGIPVLTVDSDGNFALASSATAAEQQQAQAIVSGAKLNGQPARQANDILNIFNYIKPAAANLTAQQLQNLQLLCCAVVLNQFPQLAQRINQNMGVSIPYDQANPNG